jgi:hypothetical protein
MILSLSFYAAKIITKTYKAKKSGNLSEEVPAFFVQPLGLLFNRQVFPTVRSFVQPSGFSNRQVLIFMFTNQGSG